MLFPKARLTKRALAAPLRAGRAGDAPLRQDRPLALQAFPGGIDGPGFFLKEVQPHFPDWVERVTVPKRGGTVTHALVNNAATLVYLAGQNVITPHLWLSRRRAEKPDRLIIDFDPISPAASRTFAPLRVTPASGCGNGASPPTRRLPARAASTWSARCSRGPGFGDVHKLARAVAEEMVAPATRSGSRSSTRR